MKRVFLIVLDSFGVGEAPDASDFGDKGANTLKSAYESGELNIPNLISMGLGNIDGVDCIKKADAPTAKFGKCRELSRGKDTTTGHWEIAGIVSESPMPTYPNGFPDDLLKTFEEKTGYGVLCNLPYSGTDVIRDFGSEHLETGKLIVYTSADSVFQIAAHEDYIPPEKLYDICRAAREILVGEHAVGRVIARPFITKNGEFVRTANRKDFSLVPPKETVLNKLQNEKYDVISVGKIGDIFAMSGITETYPTHSNREGMEMTSEIAKRDFSGLCFVNLVDFDMLFGHRQDAKGYANALNEFDLWLGDFVKDLREDDALIITADHGCDPSDNSTDHTREYVPLIVFGKRIESENLGTLEGFANIGSTAYEYLKKQG